MSFDTRAQTAVKAMAALNPVYLVRIFYLGCTTAILTARLLSPLRQHFLVYGARAQHQEFRQKTPISDHGVVPDILKWLASIDVPHDWFSHFYVLSIASTFAWMVYVTSELRDRQTIHNLEMVPSQSLQNGMICLLLMLVQGVRRLSECLSARSSNSRMWIGHYVFGLAFYSITNVAVWVESSSKVAAAVDSPAYDTYIPSAPFKYVGLLLFALASITQHAAHQHLAGLKKYTLPDHMLFQQIIAPHYSAECLIYLSLAIIGASDGEFFNRTLLCTVLLTVVNLGITSEGTKEWMLDKFRDQHEKIRKRWRMIPGLW